MGRAGMKRRGRRHLPKVHGLPAYPGDQARVVGQFRWGAYTPAGNLERLRFFIRQVDRNGTADGWKWGFGILRVLAPMILWIALLAAGIYGLTVLL